MLFFLCKPIIIGEICERIVIKKLGILFGSFFKIGLFTFGGGYAGALTATIAVCIPSFLIIYLISLFFDQFLSLTLVAKAFLSGVRPCVVALILSTGITMLLESLLQITQIGDAISLNLPGILIFVLLLAADFLFAKCRKKQLPPILPILLSAILGLVFC